MSESRVAAHHKPVDQITPDVLFPGHDGNRPGAITDLDGRAFELHIDGRAPISASFADGVVRWASAAEENRAYPVGSASYETIPLGHGLIGALVEHPASSSSSLLVVDGDRSRALVVSTSIHGGTSTAAESTVLLEAGIDGPLAEPFPATADLVGKRIQWEYSDTHKFEHIYVEPELYMWHGIVGPESNMGGAEPSMARRIADDLYLFTWSDHAVPFNGAIVIALGETISSTGRLVQWDDERRGIRSIIVGAHGRLLNETSYDI